MPVVLSVVELVPDWPLMLPEVPVELPLRLRFERDFDVVEVPVLFWSVVVLPVLFWSIVLPDEPVCEAVDPLDVPDPVEV